MELDADLKEIDDTETDIETLLECLKCQKRNTSGFKQSLMTLSSILYSNGKAKEYFRNIGGLEYVHDLMFQDLPRPVLYAAIYCLGCAVEKDAFGQKEIAREQTFAFLHKILREKSLERKLIHSSVFLLLCLVANNSSGQNMAKTSSCLSDLIFLFRQFAQSWQLQHRGDEDLELWSSIIATLSLCVNNPQNVNISLWQQDSPILEVAAFLSSIGTGRITKRDCSLHITEETNQRKCATLLPLCFNILSEENLEDLSRQLLSFVGLTVAGNILNQDLVQICGGLDTLLKLQQQFDSKVQLDRCQLLNAVTLINVVNTCIMDNRSTAVYFIQNQGLHFLIKLLKYPHMTSDQMLEVVITLGNALEFADLIGVSLKAQEQSVLIRLLTDTQDENIVRAVKYVLYHCQKKDNNPSSRNIVQKVRKWTKNCCPGCSSRHGAYYLDSRTFNIAIETNIHTCDVHRILRQTERNSIYTRASLKGGTSKMIPFQIWKEKQKKCDEFGIVRNLASSQNKNKNTERKKVNSCVYDFDSPDSEENKYMMVSPPHSESVDLKTKGKGKQTLFSSKSSHRQRVSYSEKELQYLLEGVQKFGKRWHQILCTYSFHPSRTTVDLKEKYKRLQKPNKASSCPAKNRQKAGNKPLSMCEIRRLKRGVISFGCSWKLILKSMKFAPGRTAEELRDKWRYINKHHILKNYV